MHGAEASLRDIQLLVFEFLAFLRGLRGQGQERAQIVGMRDARQVMVYKTSASCASARPLLTHLFVDRVHARGQPQKVDRACAGQR